MSNLRGSFSSLSAISAASPSLSASHHSGSASFFSGSSGSRSDAHLPDMHCLWDGKPLRCKGVKQGVCCTKVKYCCKHGYRCDPNGQAHCVRAPTIIVKPVILINTPAQAALPQRHHMAEEDEDEDEGKSGKNDVVVVLKNSNTIHKGACKGKSDTHCQNKATTTTTF